MATRQTLNVSLPPSQDRFVRGQVDSGRYKTASEVVREALRMMEEAEHRRLLEKWIIDQISPEEEALLPQHLKDRAKAHFSKLIDEGLSSADEEGWVDGKIAMAKLRSKVRDRFASENP